MKDEKTTKSKEQDNIQPSNPITQVQLKLYPLKIRTKAVDTKPQFGLEEIVLPPEVSKATLTIIRPTTVQEEESFTGRTADLMETMKDKTDDAIDSIMSAIGQGVSRTVTDLGSEPLVIPIIQQKSKSETKMYTEDITIEKRKVERKKNIEVKVAYDEIFVNGKEVGSSMGDAFREIKHKILDVVTFDHDRDQKELEKIKLDMIPLLKDSSEIEKVIPLYSEQIVVSKRTVKVAELIIRKRKVTETRKVSNDLITERLTVRNPTGGASTSDNDE